MYKAFDLFHTVKPKPPSPQSGGCPESSAGAPIGEFEQEPAQPARPERRWSADQLDPIERQAFNQRIARYAHFTREQLLLAVLTNQDLYMEHRKKLYAARVTIGMLRKRVRELATIERAKLAISLERGANSQKES